MKTEPQRRAKHDRWRKVMPPRGIGNGGGRQKGRGPPPANDARAVNERGIEYEAEKLTGSRAQRGNLQLLQLRMRRTLTSLLHTSLSRRSSTQLIGTHSNGGKRMPRSFPTCRPWLVSISAARLARQPLSASSHRSASLSLISARMHHLPQSLTSSSPSSTWTE